MKTSRYIILISFILTIICSVSIIFVPKDFKLYDILMGLMTGAFISFMLEIPNYAKTKRDNYRLFFYSLYNLKSSLAIFNNILEKSIKSNSRMTEKFYESNMSMIFNNFAILKNFDTDYYICKEKRDNSSFLINDINDKLNILSQCTILYEISFNTKQRDYLEATKQNLVVTADLMNEELNELSELCKSYSKYIDSSVELLLTKKQYNKWILLSEKIKNVSYNFKINN